MNILYIDIYDTTLVSKLLLSNHIGDFKVLVVFVVLKWMQKITE